MSRRYGLGIAIWLGTALFVGGLSPGGEARELREGPPTASSIELRGGGVFDSPTNPSTPRSQFQNKPSKKT
jgi:hypothetical protein